jgi:integrase
MKAGRPGPCRRSHNPSALFDRAAVLIVRLIYHAGCRPGEACAARWEDFDHARGVIVLRKHKTSHATRRARTIFVPPGMARALKRWRDRPAGHKVFIFAHRRGKNWREAGASSTGEGMPWDSTALALKVRKWRDEAITAGAPLWSEGPQAFTLYRLRHTFVTDGLHAGLSGAIAGTVVGTSERMVDRHYGHAQAEALARAARSVAEGRRARREG